MQRVQARMRRTEPPIFARTDCKLGFQRRRVLLLAWLTLFPTPGLFPQRSQTLDIFDSWRPRIAAGPEPELGNTTASLGQWEDRPSAVGRHPSGPIPAFSRSGR
jgi:hypothetical protein